MKILTLNIRSSNNVEKGLLIVSYLLREQPDIIVLSEFITKPSRVSLTKELFDSQYHIQASEENGGRGVLIASRFPFESRRIEPRWAEIYIPLLKLNVLGVYFPATGGMVINRFWEKLLNYAEEKRHSRALIAGDFNSCKKEDAFNKTPFSSKYLDKLLTSGWVDSWKEFNAQDDPNRYTWYSGHGNGFRIDYIFLSPDLKAVIQSGSVVHDPGTIQVNPERGKLSDHLAVIADLNLLTQSFHKVA